MAHDPFVTHIAETCKKLFKQGNTDPNDEEIAFALYKAKLPARWVEDIRNLLLRVRTILEEDGLEITPMNENYYTEGYRGLEQLADDEARRCIATGNGNRVKGLRLIGKTNDDRIWQAAIQQSIKTGNGKVKKCEERVLSLFQKGKLTEARTASILQTSHTLRQLSNPELAQRVMEFVPAQITAGECETQE